MAQEVSENISKINNDDNNMLDMRELLYKTKQIVKSFFLVVVALDFIGAAIAGFASYKLYTPVYSSQAVFAVRVGDGVSEDGVSYNQTVAKQMAETFPHILSSSSLEKLMKKDLDTDVLPGKMTAVAMGETNMFSLTVTSSDPEDAFNMITSAVNRYPDIAEYIIGKSELTMVISPEVPTSPTNDPNVVFYSILGFVLGVVLGLICATVAAIFSSTVISTENIENDIGCSSLGAIPLVKTNKRYEGNRSRSLTLIDNIMQNGYHDSVRFVCGTAIQRIKKSGFKTILVTSSLQSEGKTTFAVNLALSLARKGYKTVLVDCDRRSPAVMKTLRLNSDKARAGKDLSAVLKDECEIDDAIVRVGSSKLFVLPVLPSSDEILDLIESDRLNSVITTLKESYDYIVIDTAPTGLFSDAGQIARFCDGMIYIIKQNFARKSAIIDNIRRFSNTGIELVGAVLNMTSGTSDPYSSHGYGKYGYGKYSYGKYGYGKYGYANRGGDYDSFRTPKASVREGTES